MVVGDGVRFGVGAVVVKPVGRGVGSDVGDGLGGEVATTTGPPHGESYAVYDWFRLWMSYLFSLINRSNIFGWYCEIVMTYQST